MSLLRSCLLAFACYTRIPMPQLQTEPRDGDRLFCFFPLIGVVIGVCELLWLRLAAWRGFGAALTGAAAVSVPVLLTGGIHLDGFLDASDAIASWKSREERLAIMHDPHTGAFAVISCVVYLLLAFGAGSEVIDRVPYAGASVFCLGRVLTALLVVFERPAGNTGMLYQSTRGAARRDVAVSAGIYLTLLTLYALRMHTLIVWLAMLCAGAVFYIFYRIWIRRVFGGITGDLAGCFLSVCELLLLLTAAVLG